MTHDIQVTNGVEIPPTLSERATSIQVFDEAGRDAAMELARDLKAMRETIENFFEPHIKAAHAAHKSLTTERANALKPLAALEETVKGKIIAFQRLEAEKAREAQEAERQRLLTVAREEAEKRERLAKEAEEARAFGADTLAEEVEAEAVKADTAAFMAERQAVRVQPGKPQGLREVWKWRVVDKTLIPREFLEPNKDKLDYHARKQRDEPIPGIEFYADHTLAVR